MKQLTLIFTVLIIVVGSVCAQEADEITWTNYFGIGAGFEIKNIQQDHTALHLSGAVARRMMPHFHLMLQAGFYPFSDGNIFSAFSDEYYEILTVGLAGKLSTASGGHGPGFYGLLGGGWASLKNRGKGSYLAAGGGYETELGPRLGAYFQGLYVIADPSDSNIQFVTLSAGISFSPR